MARDAIDAVARGLDRSVPPSAHRTSRRWSAPTASRRCGTGASALAASAACTSPGSSTCCAATARGSTTCWRWSPSARSSAEPLPGADDYLAVEVRYAATHEGALHLDDVLTRRTRISIETWDRGLEAAAPAARLMAEVLGWDERDDRPRGRDLPRARRGRAALAGAARRPRRRPRAHEPRRSQAQSGNSRRNRFGGRAVAADLTPSQRAAVPQRGGQRAGRPRDHRVRRPALAARDVKRPSADLGGEALVVAEAQLERGPPPPRRRRTASSARSRTRPRRVRAPPSGPARRCPSGRGRARPARAPRRAA